MLLPSVASLADLDINLGGYSVVYAAGIEVPTITKAFIGTNTISGGNLHRGKINGKNARGTVHVTLKDSSGNEKATVSVTPKSGTTWTVKLTGGVTIAEGDTVTAYQEFDGQNSPSTTANAMDSLAIQNKDKLKMPTGEIWIEQTSSNQVNDDEQAEAVQMFNNANTAISGDIKSVKFSIDTAEHAYYEVTYTDGSTSGKIEAPNLKIKQVTEYSRGATLGSITIVDNVIKGQLSGEGPFDGIKVQIVLSLSDAVKDTYCDKGKCLTDKDTSDPVDATVDGKTGEFTYTIPNPDLKLDQKVGVTVKEPHKFKSCSQTPVKPVVVGKTEVKDPRKLTKDDKTAIVNAIKEAYKAPDGTSKLPNGTGDWDGVPAVIQIDDSGNVKIFSGNNVAGTWDWDNGGIFVPEKNEDGSVKLTEGAQPKITIQAKDLLKNIKPDAPTLALSEDKKNITITPNEKDTDAHIITVSYKDKDGKDQTTTATKADDGTWSIAGEGSVDANGVVTLPKDKVKGDTTVTATVTDKGGIADDDTTPLTSDPGKLTVEETIADKVEALGGLDPVALKKWVKDTVDWKEGVKAKDDAKKDEVNKLLEGATFTDETETKRSTDKSGDFTGKVKVKFSDDSEIIVEKQMLYVSDLVSPSDKENLPKDAIDVELKLGEGVKAGEKTGNKETPVTAKTYKVKPGTDLSKEKVSKTEKTCFEDVGATVKDDTYVDVAWKDSKDGKDFKATADNKVFTAAATKIQVSITYDANGGSGEMAKETKDKGSDYTVLPNAFKAPDDTQEFDTWEVDGQRVAPGTSIKVKDNTVIKALWKKSQVSITYDANGGSGEMAKETKDKGSKYTVLPNAFKAPDDTKEFKAWEVDGKEIAPGTEITVNGDTVIKAIWKGEKVDIEFNHGEGSGEMTKEAVTKGSKYKLPASTFTAPEGKEFKGWKIGETEYAPGAEITVKGNITLVAQWKPIEEPGITPVPNPNEPGEDEFYIPEFRIHREVVPTIEVYAEVPKTEKVEKLEEVPVSLETHKAYIAGYEDNTLRAEGNITRAEAAAMVTRLAGLDLSDNSMPAFKDMQKNAWYFRYINAAVKANMLDADNGMMRPNDKITRAEFAKMLAAIDKENSSVSKFEDIKGHRYEKEINKIYGNNRIEGYEDGSFRPDANLTRAESAAFLNRMFNRIADKEAYAGLEDKLAKFKDFDSSKWYYDEMVEATNSHELTRRGKASDKYGRVYEKWTRILGSDVR